MDPEIKVQLRFVTEMLQGDPENAELLEMKRQLDELVALSGEVRELRGPEVDIFSSDLGHVGDRLDLLNARQHQQQQLGDFLPSSLPKVQFLAAGAQQAAPPPRRFDSSGRTVSVPNQKPPAQASSLVKEGIAEWEQHTTGIGSRLLMKMGYIPGRGLGKERTGRAEPVELDKQAGSSRLGLGHDWRDSTAPRELQRKRLASLKEAGLALDDDDYAESSSSEEEKEEDMFDFMNTALNAVNVTVPAPAASSSSYRSLTPEGLRSALLQVQEALTSSTANISRLQMGVERNAARDPAAAHLLSQKLQIAEAEHQRLLRSEQELQTRIGMNRSAQQAQKKKLF